jgi:RHS repeat-associated protein
MRCLTRTLIVVFFFVALSGARAWAGATVSYEYDKYGNCRVITTKDSAGQVLEQSTYAYDNFRRPIEMVEAAHTGSNARRWTWYYDRWFGSQSYDPHAHTSRQWRVQVEPAFNAAGERNLTARWFDANDRILDEYTGVIEAPSGAWSNGPDLEVHHFTYDKNGQKETYTDPRGRITNYVYDLRNRLRDTIEPKRADQSTRPTTTIDYDFAGNKTDVTFPDGRSQHWRDYDAFGQARQFIDERNNPTDMTYVWGSMKKLYTVKTYRDKDGGGTEEQQTTFSYDLLGRPTAIAFPDQSSEVSTYQFGQLKTYKTRKGQLKTISYDAQGREVSHTFDDPATPAISRSWDDANRALTLCNIYSTIDYQYDGAGLVWKEGNSIAGSGDRAVTIYTRHPNGSVSQIQYPGGVSVRKTYISRGQLKTVEDDTGGYWKATITYSYLADGKVDYQEYRSGVRTQYGYDDRGITSLVRNYRQSSGQDLSRRNYYRDNRDRIVAFQKGGGNPVNPMEDGRGDHYWYDAEGQLTHAFYGAADPVNNPQAPARQDQFEYDQLGNRQSPNGQYDNLLASKGWMKFTRKNNGLNQYSGWWDYSFIKYDDDIGGSWAPQYGNGVLMQDGNMTAGYNALNQAVMVNTAAMGSDWMFFGYDPLGRCVKRWRGALNANAPFPGIPAATSNPATYFYYDGWSLIQEGSGSADGARLYFHGGRVDEIVASYNASTDVMAYHYYDANGNCTMLTDHVGNILEQYEYDAFGQPYFFSSTAQPLNSSTFGNRFLFTGREYLSDLKLYDYRNRMYQPELGRFMQPDPEHFAGGDQNLYRYCRNDPVNRTDPTGLISFSGTVEKQQLTAVTGSHIPQWLTIEKISINFTTSGNYMDSQAARHVVDAASPVLAGLKGRTVTTGTVVEGQERGKKVLNANLNIDYWTRHVKYDSLEREHTFGVEGGGSRTKGILEKGGVWERFRNEWSGGATDFLARWRVDLSLQRHLRDVRREHKGTWDSQWGHHNVPW